MSSDRKASMIGGLLIIAGIIVGILSIVPSVEGDNYLTEVYPNKNSLLTGALFQFFLVPIYIGFALVLYPILKKYKENLAIGFVGFRIMSGVFQLVGVILLPMFLLLSREFIKAENQEFLYIETSGQLLKLGRDLANHLGVMLATGLGNLILYYIFYKTKLIPRWLSIWGVIGNVLAMLSGFLILFGSIDVVSTTFIMITTPIIIQEIVLAIWLIGKGFAESVTKKCL